MAITSPAATSRHDITGAGESTPGPRGAIYVGEMGSVLLNGEVSITETSITDDFGGEGGRHLQPWQGGMLNVD